MQSCGCHRNGISAPTPFLVGAEELAISIFEIGEYLNSSGDDYLLERLDQIAQLAKWAISQCRVCHKPAIWFGYGNEESIIHVCTSHRATAGLGYTWVRIGHRLGFDD